MWLFVRSFALSSFALCIDCTDAGSNTRFFCICVFYLNILGFRSMVSSSAVWCMVMYLICCRAWATLKKFLWTHRHLHAAELIEMNSTSCGEFTRYACEVWRGSCSRDLHQIVRSSHSRCHDVADRTTHEALIIHNRYFHLHNGSTKLVLWICCFICGVGHGCGRHLPSFGTKELTLGSKEKPTASLASQSSASLLFGRR